MLKSVERRLGNANTSRGMAFRLWFLLYCEGNWGTLSRGQACKAVHSVRSPESNAMAEAFLRHSSVITLAATSAPSCRPFSNDLPSVSKTTTRTLRKEDCGCAPQLIHLTASSVRGGAMRGNSTDHAELERIRCVPCAACRVDAVYPLVPSLRNPLSGFTHSGAARCSPQQGPRCVEHTPVSLVVHLQAFKAGLCLAATCRHHIGEDAC